MRRPYENRVRFQSSVPHTANNTSEAAPSTTIHPVWTASAGRVAPAAR